MTLRTIRRKGVPKRVANIQARFSPYPKQAAGYCKKGEFMTKEEQPDDCSCFFDNPHPEWRGFEWGTICSPGRRTDYLNATARIDEGEDVEKIFDESPHLEHQNGRALMSRYQRRHRNDMREHAPWTTVIIGKKKDTWEYVKNQYQCIDRDKFYYWRSNDNGCNDNYRGEKYVVVLEHENWSVLEEMCSDRPFYVKCRYIAGRAFTSPNVIICRDHEYVGDVGFKRDITLKNAKELLNANVICV
jgi:hypothetical protein